jgi:hypothetical protein
MYQFILYIIKVICLGREAGMRYLSVISTGRLDSLDVGRRDVVCDSHTSGC